MKLRPVHSTCVVTSTLLATSLAQVIHVFVLTENTPPLGTSGVRVVVSMVTNVSKSHTTISSRSSHRVCFGPMLALSGLMYVMLRASNFEPSVGIQSEI